LQQGLKFEDQSRMIKQTPTRFHFDEEIHVAFFVCFPPRHRPEDTNVMRTVLRGYAENLIALGV
jgi:hypothetical protein